MPVNLAERIEAVLGQPPSAISSLGGRDDGQVFKVQLRDGSIIVAKTGDGSRGQLELEGFMLRFLADASRLPVPEVHHSEADLLLTEYLPGLSNFSAGAQRHAAEVLAELHAISDGGYGFERDTVIGGLPQPNPHYDSWLDFFREQRLSFMGQEAVSAGRLPGEIFARLMSFGDRLDEWLEEPESPSLIHGDAWAGNILAKGDRITGFVDPAIYYADAEIELAFTTLFSTFGEEFFHRYEEIRPIKPGFWETRRDIYNLYPLLVHVRLFGGSYVSSVDDTLRRLGF